MAVDATPAVDVDLAMDVDADVVVDGDAVQPTLVGVLVRRRAPTYPTRPRSQSARFADQRNLSRLGFAHHRRRPTARSRVPGAPGHHAKPPKGNVRFNPCAVFASRYYTAQLANRLCRTRFGRQRLITEYFNPVVHVDRPRERNPVRTPNRCA